MMLETVEYSRLEDKNFRLKEVKKDHYMRLTFSFFNDYKEKKKQYNEAYVTIKSWIVQGKIEEDIVIDYSYKEPIEVNCNLLKNKMSELKELIIEEIKRNKNHRLLYQLGEINVKLYWEV